MEIVAAIAVATVIVAAIFALYIHRQAQTVGCAPLHPTYTKNP